MSPPVRKLSRNDIRHITFSSLRPAPSRGLARFRWWFWRYPPGFEPQRDNAKPGDDVLGRKIHYLYFAYRPKTLVSDDVGWFFEDFQTLRLPHILRAERRQRTAPGTECSVFKDLVFVQIRESSVMLERVLDCTFLEGTFQYRRAVFGLYWVYVYEHRITSLLSKNLLLLLLYYVWLL